MAVSRSQFGLRIAESRQLFEIKGVIAFWQAVGTLYADLVLGRRKRVSKTKRGYLKCNYPRSY